MGLPGRFEAAGAVSGRASCVPREARPQATLWQQLLHGSGTVPVGLWREKHLLLALEEFGHMTKIEIQQRPVSVLQRLALRAAEVR